MTTSTFPQSLYEVANDLDRVERDLWDRLNMITSDTDLVVVLGLVAAGEVSESVLDKVIVGDTQPVSILDLAKLEIKPDQFSRFQKLWYHFRVPSARASLVWWYLFCLALGRDNNVTDALQQMTEWLGVMIGTPESAVPLVGDLLGLPGRIVVVTDAEMTDLAALIAAVKAKAPLIAVNDIATARRIGRASGREVLITTHEDEQVGDLWLGRPVNLRQLPIKAQMAWQQLGDQDRIDLLSQLEKRISSIERVRLLIGETVTDNRSVVQMLAECCNEPVAEWPPERLALATLLWCWQVGGFVLQELNQSLVCFPALAVFLIRRIREYQCWLPEEGPQRFESDDPILLAEELDRLRKQIERRYERCLFFDGSNWERREFLLPLSVYRRTAEIPQSLRDHLHKQTGAEFPCSAGGLDAWDRFLELALQSGSTPSRIIQEIAHWAANAEDFWVDLAIFTVPLGRKLDQPWTMEFTDLFCYTGFRNGFRPECLSIPMDRVGVHNVIGQRMRYNAVKKAQNYAPVMRFSPQGFNLPDIAVAEDANHAGHSAAGIRLACRIPITITYGGHDWNGLSDVRLNRAEYRRENRFQPRDLITGHRYAQWAKGIADATYRRGLSFDEKWANKVKDLDI